MGSGTGPRERARHRSPFGYGNQLYRIVWNIGWVVLAKFTPPPMHAWRASVLRLFGAKIGRNVRVYGSCRIWDPRRLSVGHGATLGRRIHCYNQGFITIGSHVVLSWEATLCSSTHNVEDPLFPLLLRPIEIQDEAWIAAGAFVGPGVTVGTGAVLGAHSVAMRALESWTYYSGNPAAPLKSRHDFTTLPIEELG